MKCKLKAQWYIYLSEWLKLKALTIAHGCKATGILIHCWWECKIKQRKVKHTATTWSSHSTPRYLPRRFQSVYSYIYVHSSFLCNSQKLETFQTPINRWMNKQIVTYPYNGIIRNELLINAINLSWMNTK